MIHLRLALFASNVCWTLNGRKRCRSLELGTMSKNNAFKTKKRDPFALVLACGVLLSFVMWVLQRQKFDKKKSLYAAPTNDLLQFMFFIENLNCAQTSDSSNTSFGNIEYIRELLRNTWQSQIILTNLFACPFYFYFNFNSEWIFSTFLWRNLNDFYYVVVCIEIRFLELRLFIYLTMNHKKRFWILLKERQRQIFGRAEWMFSEKVKRIFIQSLFGISH